MIRRPAKAAMMQSRSFTIRTLTKPDRRIITYRRINREYPA